MRLRTWLQTGTYPLSPIFYVGDSMLGGTSLTPKISWAGADLSLIFSILQMVWVPCYKIVVFHAGTNNLTQFQPCDSRYKQRDNKTGEIRAVTAAKVWRNFLQNYHLTGQILSWGVTGPPKFLFSQILPRHDIAPRPSGIRKPGRPSSKVDLAASGVNKHARKLAETERNFFFAAHPQFRDPGLFDGLHPNRRGVRILGESLQEAAEALM